MHYREQLRAAGLYCMPIKPYTPLKNGKKEKRTLDFSWKLAYGEKWPLDHPQFRGQWDDEGAVAVVVPEGITIIDVDTHKGATCEKIDELLGVKIDWERSLIQRTPNGGTHHAFNCSWARQGSDINGLMGFDTRRAHGGLIFSDLKNYTPVGFGGVMRIINPAAFPQLPDGARAVLGKPTHEVRETPFPTSPEVLQSVENMLRAIPAPASRDPWLKAGMALKVMYRDDVGTGFMLFDRWSSGDFGTAGTPDGYAGTDDCQRQWDSFKVDKTGGITGGTLFHMARQHGWAPSRQELINFSAAFRGAYGVDAAEFERLFVKVRSDGADSKLLLDIIEEIKLAGCDHGQKVILGAELERELKDSGSLNKKTIKLIEDTLGLSARKKPQAAGEYGKSDRINAESYLSAEFPGETLAYSEGMFYKFVGTHWDPLKYDDVKLATENYLTGIGQLQHSAASTAFKVVVGICSSVYHSLSHAPTPHLVRYLNGMLDLRDKRLYPHDKQQFASSCLPFEWNPKAACQMWTDFVAESFGYDQQCVELLQEWFGYMLTRSHEHQNFMVLYGPSGSGKSVMTNILKELIGKDGFVGGDDMEDLLSESKLELMSTGQCLVLADIPPTVPKTVAPKVTTKIKCITSGDTISWHRMYVGSVSKVLPVRLTITCNAVPNLFDDSGALGKRMLLLKTDKGVRGEAHEDKQLFEKLCPELPGIACWALEGLERLRTTNRGMWTAPSRMKQLLQDLRDESSPLSAFIRDYIDYTGDPKDRISCRQLMDAYYSSRPADEARMSSYAFGRAIRTAADGTGMEWVSARVEGSAEKGLNRARLLHAPAGAAPAGAVLAFSRP
jgi:P4 family phage/plasmid primase-like protien